MASGNGRRAGSADLHIRSGAQPRSPRGGHVAGSPQTSSGSARRGASGDSGNGGGRKPAGKSKLKKIAVALASAALVLGIAYVVLSNTNVFEITSVEVEGSTRLSDSYLTTAASVPKGTNLLNVDAGSISARISANPWVSSVRVKRGFPHTLVLQINEKMPAAVVEVQPSSGDAQTRYWLIGSDATWMGEVTQEGVQTARQMVIDSTGDGDVDSNASQTTSDAQPEASICSDVRYTATELSAIPIITETASGISPEVGAVETDSGITNALAIIEDSKGDFGDQIATITSASGSSTSVILKNGVEVSFGEATDMDAKISVAQDLLNRYEGQISYINVRVASRPAWRGTE